MFKPFYHGETNLQWLPEFSFGAVWRNKDITKGENFGQFDRQLSRILTLTIESVDS